MQDQMNRLELVNIGKRFGKNEVLKGLSYSFGPGIYLITGGNGAGKSTLLEIIMGIRRPDCGSVLFNGEAISHGARIGYVPQKNVYYRDFTGWDFLRYMGLVQNMEPGEIERSAGSLLGLFRLEEAAAERICTYSGGMKRRLMICSALLNNPEVLLLDEATAGVDRENTEALRGMLLENGNRVVLFCTHLESDAERLPCRRLRISDGRLVEWRENDADRLL